MIEQRRYVPAEDIELFLDYLNDLLSEYVDREQVSEIIKRLQQFKVSDYED